MVHVRTRRMNTRLLLHCNWRVFLACSPNGRHHGQRSESQCACIGGDCRARACKWEPPHICSQDGSTSSRLHGVQAGGTKKA
eukprot:1156372-Pelagomonas_calceolata.AAC.1